jgi:hypothetical protein
VYARCKALLPEQFAHELQGRGLVSPWLHKDVEDLALTIDGSPEMYSSALDRDHHLIQVPGTSRSRSQTPRVAGKAWTKFQHPPADRLIRDPKSPVSQQLFDIPVAQRKAQIEPDCLTNDLG